MFDEKQISVYLQKFLRLFLDTKTLMFLLQAVLLPFIVSKVFDPGETFDNYRVTKTASFALVSSGVWIGLFNSVTNICNERKVIKFEYKMKGLSLSSYMAARVLSELVLCLVETFLMMMTIVIIYSHIQANLFQIILLSITLFLVIFTSDMMALVISSSVKKSGQAMAIMPMILLLQIMFSNFIEALDGKDLLTKLISYLTLTKWGTTAFFRISNQTNLIPSKGDVDYQAFTIDGATTFSFNIVSIIGNWITLIIFAGVFIVLATLLLKNINHDTR